MKKNRVYWLLIALVILLSGCDPKYPMGKLKIEKIPSMSIGESIEVKLIYPSDGMAVIGWKDQQIEIMNNSNVIQVHDLTITAVKAGTATIKISATTILSDSAYRFGNEDRIYSVSAKVTVK